MREIGSVNGNPRQYRERLAKFVAEQGIALEYSEEIAPARGTSSGGKIIPRCGTARPVSG
ncbi:MAG TPA: hypothetical protein VGS20_00360 [Candidatus Acidoferrales bacterium]|nr:hypothetical protein [Candidatus Acidoferrales bacterium]